METSTARPPNRLSQFSRWLLPIAVFTLLASATIVAWRWQQDVQREAMESVGNQESAAITAEIRERLRLHAQFLRSVQAFASAGNARDLAAWRRFAQEIDLSDNLSGLYAFAYAPLVQPEQLQAFVATTRRQADRSEFKIFPVRSGETLAPILFIAPDMPEQRKAIGFNLFSEDSRAQAATLAATMRDVSMTGPIVLLMDHAAQRTGFMIMQALYRPGMPLNNTQERRVAFDGIVLTAYRLDDFLKSTKHGLNANFTVQIFDESLTSENAGDGKAKLIYTTDPDFKGGVDDKHFHHEIDFAGRNWILHFYPQRTAFEDRSLDIPGLILFGGLAGSALLALLVFNLTTHRQRVEHHARQLTRDLHRSEERFRLATAGSNDGIWDQNLQTQEDFISPRMAEIFGFPPTQAPARLSDFVAMVAPEDADRCAEALRLHMKCNIPLDMQLRIRKANGDPGWIRVRGEAVRNAQGLATRIAGSVTDVTDRQRDDDELRRHRDHLQELVSERTASLEDALQKMQAANQAKTEFLANMSHELRTPMHAILSFSELGEDKANSIGQEKIAQYCSRIQQSAKRLLALIDELLDLSKIEASRLELDYAPTDMLALIQQVEAQLEPLLQQRQLTLVTECRVADRIIDADAARLTQVVQNLLSNAIKFSPEGGTIRVEIDAGQLPAGRRAADHGIREARAIRFIDSGVGIPADEVESIFDKFVQSSLTKTGAGGTGLGLAISRGIVRQHRGTIVAKNNAEGGACITVTLPTTLKTAVRGKND